MAARWGGDEFAIVTYLKDDETPEMFEETIRTQVNAVRENENLDYSISISVGYASIRRGDPLAVILASVDRNLYNQKNKHHLASSKN